MLSAAPLQRGISRQSSPASKGMSTGRSMDIHDRRACFRSNQYPAVCGPLRPDFVHHAPGFFTRHADQVLRAPQTLAAGAVNATAMRSVQQ